jgi:hypothetical protein
MLLELNSKPSDVRLQRGTRSTLVEPGYPGRSCDFCQGPLMFLCFSVLIDARSSMPNPSGKIWRCNVPPEGCTLHRIFQSSMPNHRCPIIELQSIETKTMDVQFATWGGRRQIAQTFPIIDARSSMPNPSEKYGGAIFSRRVANCTGFSHHRCPIFRARPLNIRERPLNRREHPLNRRERQFNFRERPVS